MYAMHLQCATDAIAQHRGVPKPAAKKKIGGRDSIYSNLVTSREICC